MNSGERWKLAADKRVRWLMERMMQQQNVFLPFREDIRQECMIKLYERAPDYNSALGSVLTFAKHIIRGVLTAWRRGRSMFGPRNDRDPPATRCFSRARLHLVDRTVFGIEDRTLGPTELGALQALPALERTVVLLAAAGDSYTEIGAAIGYSRQGAQYIERKALEHLRATLAA